MTDRQKRILLNVLFYPGACLFWGGALLGCANKLPILILLSLLGFGMVFLVIHLSMEWDIS